MRRPPGSALFPYRRLFGSGRPAERPVYRVCAHGGHEACCALRGRPLARALPADDPDDVWECSHLGGDRFAANVLVLPHGFYYGQVPGDGAELRSEEHTSELQSRQYLVCRLLLEKKKSGPANLPVAF